MLVLDICFTALIFHHFTLTLSEHFVTVYFNHFKIDRAWANHNDGGNENATKQTAVHVRSLYIRPRQNNNGKWQSSK